MKKFVIALVASVMLSGCAPAPKPFCTGFVKSFGGAGEEHYGLKVQKVRIKGDRFPVVQLRTKFGWWDLSQFDLKYGDCKFKLEQSNYL